MVIADSKEPIGRCNLSLLAEVLRKVLFGQQCIDATLLCTVVHKSILERTWSHVLRYSIRTLPDDTVLSNSVLRSVRAMRNRQLWMVSRLRESANEKLRRCKQVANT